MPPRHFTLEQANELLEIVRPLAQRLVAHRRQFVDAQRRRAGLVAKVAGNGGGLDAAAVTALDERIGAELASIARCVNGIHELGGVVKDLDEGLVDFPALVDGQEAYLCWKLGEDQIEHWHGVDEGFSGRKRLQP